MNACIEPGYDGEEERGLRISIISFHQLLFWVFLSAVCYSCFYHYIAIPPMGGRKEGRDEGTEEGAFALNCRWVVQILSVFLCALGLGTPCSCLFLTMSLILSIPLSDVVVVVVVVVDPVFFLS
jgi:hypothetical protein